MIIKDIKSLKAHLAKGRFNNNDILPFLSVLRIEIEKGSLQEDLKWLNLFCNWSLHPKISSSMVAVDIMQSFVFSLLEWDLGNNNEVVKFNESIIGNFRRELIQLLKMSKVDHTFISEDEIFIPIFNYMLNVIHDRPLILPSEQKINKSESRKERVNSLNKSISSLYKNKECEIESLKITHNKENQLSWYLTTTAYIDIELPIGYKRKRFVLNS